MKKCTVCEIEKPLSEFYANEGRKDGLFGSCKKCVRQQSKKHYRIKGGNSKRHSSGHETENTAINRLTQEGIVAFPGKYNKHSWIDIMAWGCVAIEVKCGYLDDRGKSFNFNSSPSQVRANWRADIVILMIPSNSSYTYHIFNAEHPVFFKNGRLKSGITYTFDRTYPVTNREGSITLTSEMLDEALNQWGRINDCRDRISSQLKNGAKIDQVIKGVEFDALAQSKSQ